MFKFLFVLGPALPEDVAEDKETENEGKPSPGARREISATSEEDREAKFSVFQKCLILKTEKGEGSGLKKGEVDEKGPFGAGEEVVDVIDDDLVVVFDQGGHRHVTNRQKASSFSGRSTASSPTAAPPGSN